MATKYTVYNTDTNSVEATGRPWPTADGSQPVGMDDNLALLEEVPDARPTYDSNTHKLEKNAIAYDVQAGTATQGWSVVALTQAEIDERTPAHVEINGIKWKTDEASQAAFSSMTLLLDKAGMADTDMVAIKDAHDVTQGLTVAQYQADAITYGLHCYTLFHS